jgi:hypothetical protein
VSVLKASASVLFGFVDEDELVRLSHLVSTPDLLERNKRATRIGNRPLAVRGAM